MPSGQGRGKITHLIKREDWGVLGVGCLRALLPGASCHARHMICAGGCPRGPKPLPVCYREALPEQRVLRHEKAE